MEQTMQQQAHNDANPTQDDRDAIERILEYLRLYPVSMRDLDRTEKDLTGMAGEARARGESFAQAIGGEEADFTRRLAQGLGRATPLERGLRVLQIFCLIGLWYWLFGLHKYPFFLLLERLSITWGQLTYVLLGTAWFTMAQRFFTLRQIYGGKVSKPLYTIVNVVIFILLVLPVNMALRDWSVVFITLPAWPLAIALAVPGFGALLLRRWLRNRPEEPYGE